MRDNSTGYMFIMWFIVSHSLLIVPHAPRNWKNNFFICLLIQLLTI